MAEYHDALAEELRREYESYKWNPIEISEKPKRWRSKKICERVRAARKMKCDPDLVAKRGSYV